ncbi:MAG: Gfo/Idh/MocA family protein [Bacteroidota bacterium]
MIKVGLIGCSGHYGFVLEGMRELGEAELRAVAPGCRDEDLSPLLARPEVKLARPRIYEDYRRMLAEEPLDIVGVDCFFHLHAEVCQAALAHGVAPFCEKPLALDLASLEILRARQLDAGLPIGMMLNYRYEPMFRSARQLVASGTIGEVVLGYAQKSYKLGRRPSIYRRRETFGGIIPWVGIHAIDWFRWISGRRYLAVSARHANLHAKDYPGLEDQAACLFELDNGGSAVMSFDYLRPMGAPGHGDDRLRLVGTHGCLEIRHPEALEVYTNDGPLAVGLATRPYGPFADFARAVVDGTHTCAVSTDDAFDLSEIVLRTREAADRGLKVVLFDEKVGK